MVGKLDDKHQLSSFNDKFRTMISASRLKYETVLVSMDIFDEWIVKIVVCVQMHYFKFTRVNNCILIYNDILLMMYCIVRKI